MSSHSDTSSLPGSDEGKVHYEVGVQYSPGDHEKQDTSRIAAAIANVDSFTESMFSEEDLEMIFSHLNDRPFEEWLELLRGHVEFHGNDTGIPADRLQTLNSLVKGPAEDQSEEEWQEAVKFEGFLFHEWSIYPEVRAVTRPPVLEDDPTEEYQTFRSMAIGVIIGGAGSVMATFFEPRYPPISIGSLSLQIMLAGIGHLMAKLPRMVIPLGFGRKFVFNTGKPWGYREHMLSTLAMAITDASPYAQDAFIAQSNKFFYDFDGANQFGYIILLLLSSQLMGFGFGGIFRAMIIYPSKMVYYSNLPYLKVARSLVDKDVREKVDGWKLKQWEFFAIVTVIIFGYYWITNVLMGFLSYFTWICWAAPNNVNANAITGMLSGLGLNPFPSFDPSVFGNFGGIATPAWAYCNVMFGVAISFVAICIIWYTNVAHTGYLPINSNSLYDNTGEPWNVTRVQPPGTKEMNVDAYQDYSLPYWCAGNVAVYGVFFMIYPAGFLHGIMYYWGDLVEGFKTMATGLKVTGKGGRAIDAFNDPFSRRMQQYKEVPEWWYMVVLLGTIGMAIGTVEGYKFTDTPVWTIFLGIGLSLVFLPMVSILMSKTNSSYATNVLFELIVGYALPGKAGTALLVGKTYATNFFSEAEDWITNQKMAHYAGIAPRTLFWAQMVSAVVTCFVQAGIITWQLGGGIRDMCDVHNRQKMTCQSTHTYFNASIIWGLIGPRRVFKGLYPKMKWCFLIGACYPLPFWAVRKFGPTIAKKRNLQPKTWVHWFVSGECLHYVNEMLWLLGALNWGSTNTSYMLVDFYVCLFFNLYIQKRWPRWWTKYAYLLFAGSTNGNAWAGLFNFFATQYHHIVSVNWWGNEVAYNTLDGEYAAVRLMVNVTAGDYFGPRKGQLP